MSSDNRLSFVSPITPPGRDAFYSSIPVVWSDPTDCIVCLSCARDTSTEPVTNEVVIPKPVRVYPEQMLYTNSQQVIECDLGGSYTVPAGLFGSNTSQAEADAQAVTYGTNICNGNYWNEAQTITCPDGGGSVTVNAHLFYSPVSQIAANNLAIASGNLSCGAAASLNGLRWLLPCTNVPVGDICSCSGTPIITTATMLGAAGQIYNVELLFRGVFEINGYSGGARTGYFQVGGSPSGLNNQYQLQVSDPAQTYWLNANDVQINNRCYLANYSETIQIRAGATVTLVADSTDSGQYENQDGSGNPISAPDTTPGHPIGVTQPYDGQFLQMDVISIST